MRARVGLATILLGSSALLAATSVAGSSPRTSFGDALPGLSAAELALFEDGKEEFEEAETPEDGLGPVFNEASCVACHNVPAVGGGSGRLETRFGRTAPDGSFDPLTELGGSLLQDNAILGFDPEVVPPEGPTSRG
jgi:Di-haem oxidoreductase, putative peroxidase